MEAPGELQAQLLLERLNRNNCTWEVWNPQGEITDQTKGSIVRAVTDDGRRLVSHTDIGLAEMLAGLWIRRRAEKGCIALPLLPGHGLQGEQEGAASLLLSHPVACLSGLPGTGKSYLMREVYRTWRKAGHSVALLSFTGAAASRLGEACEGTGSTIHRFLEYDGNQFGRNQDRPVECGHGRNCECGDQISAVIIDEAGMLGIVLTWSLLKALPEDCLVLFVGDPRQLPSVDHGNVLEDLCDVLPHARLTQIRRTDSDGPIGLAAADILRGEVPRNAESKGDGFYQIPHDDDETLYSKARAIHARLAEVHRIKIPMVRCMAPTNLAVENYNREASAHYSDGPPPYIATRNNSRAGYFNGDLGYRVGDLIYFDGGATDFYNESLHSLAFATTVYKMQGREAEASQLIIPNRRPGVPKIKEVYTAVTRAKRRFVVTGNLEFFAKAIRQSEPRRLSLLREFVRGEASVIRQS